MTEKTHEQELIRQFEEIAQFELPVSVAERDLERVRQSLMAHGSRRGVMWRRIAASRWAQGLSAIAACLVLVLMIHCFGNTQLSAAELLTRVAANLNKARWVKNVTSSYLPGQTEPASVDEQWMDLEDKKAYSVFNGTYIHLWDYTQMHHSIYNPKSNELVIDKFSGEMVGAGTQLNEYVKKLRHEGLKVTQSKENATV